GSGEDAGYLDSLRSYADQVAPGRVEFRPPVPPFEIVRAIADGDIGLCFIPGSTFAYRMTLPNKLFEFMVAGLAVVSGPSQEMARVVREAGSGWVTKDFSADALVESLNSLTLEQIEQARQKARQAAKLMNAEVEYAKLLPIYAKMLKDT
ncbi:MAG: glycosyltransferase, partial [Chloroflexota bacterium]